MPWDITPLIDQHRGRRPGPFPVDWTAVEEWLGLTLPDDYKRLANHHGPLDFGDYVWIHVPCSDPSGRFNFGEWLRKTHRATRIDLRALPEEARPAVHPAPGGLLAWGQSRSSDVLFWDTSVSDDPNAWTVVRHTGATVSRGQRPLLRYDLTLTQYLQHITSSEWEYPAQVDGQTRPLPSMASRTAFLQAAQPWVTPVPAAPRLSDTERLVALQTGTGLDALQLLTPPPKTPYLGTRSWSQLFEELGTRLPDSYVTLMELYGAGIWTNWLRFHTPLRADKLSSFAGHIAYFEEAYTSLADSFPEEFPLTIWPTPGGVLPFASSIDGDHLCWLTEGGDPNDWPLIVVPRHAEQGPALQIGLIDLLVSWQRGAWEDGSFPTFDIDDDPLELVSFTPWDDNSHW